MKFIAAMLLFVGITSGLAISQQPPPPPPPQSPADVAAQASSQGAQTANQAPQAATQQSPTQPVIPTPPPRQGAAEATQSVNLPQKEKLEAELSRIQAQEELVTLREKDQSRLHDSRGVMKEALSAKVPIPSAILQKAKCVVVIPGLKKAAVGFGAKYGRGVMTCRLGQDYTGPWSAPAMYAVEGGNFGLQIGLQGTDLVLLVMNERGVDSLLGTKFKLGGDAALSAGPFGRNMEASTDLAMRAKILAYSRSHGVFAGVSLDGSTLRPDNRANQALYGREISARQIVRNGDVMVPTDGAPLIQLLDESVKTASNTTVPGETRQK